MNPVLKAFLYPLLDDMVDVGVGFWAKYAFVAMLLTYAFEGVFPFALIIGLVLTTNLLVAAVVSLWWDKWGREKYATQSIVDMGRQKQNQRQ